MDESYVSNIHKIFFDIINDEPFCNIINNHIDNFIQKIDFYDNSIDGSCIKNNSINELQLSDYSIVEQKISNNSISNNKIQDNAISAKKILNKSIHSNHIANYSITTDKLGISSVSTSNLSDHSITAEKICDGAITLQKLSKNVFSNIIIPNNYINNSKLANHTITASKIALNTITADHLDNNIFSNIFIPDNFISGNKINSHSINFDKFSPNVSEILINMINGTISTFVFNKILGTNIENNTITLSNLNDDILSLLHNPIIPIKSISGSHICLKSITSDNLVDNTIMLSNLNNEILSLLHNPIIPLKSIIGTQINLKTITSDNLADNTIMFSNLNSDVFEKISQIQVPNGSITEIQLSSELLNTIKNNNIPNKSITENMFASNLIVPIGTYSTFTFVGTNIQQILTNKIFVDNSILFQNNLDPSKKFFFNLSALSSNTTCIITIPNTSTSLVGTDNIQTITNKIIDSDTNTVTCNKLRVDSTKNINIVNTTCEIGQTLVSTNPTTLSLQYLSHLHLLDAGIFTHLQIDSHIQSSASIHGVSSSIVGISDIQILSNKTFIDPLFVNSNNLTKKISFNISGSNNSDIILTIPPSSTTLVGIDSSQILKNKTLDHISNFITADNLHSATTTININSSTAPNANQALIAISSTAAAWQNINHSNLSNVGTNSHIQIDNHINSPSNIHGLTSFIVGTEDIQILKNKKIEANSNVFMDSSDDSKNMNFILTNLQTSTSVALTIPPSSTTLVGDDSLQTITNKTLDSPTNYITSDNLRSKTNIININLSNSPIINQTLIATSSNTAIWQTINHLNLSNIGTNSHIQIDSHLSSSSNVHGVLGSIVGTSDIQTLTNKTLNSTTNIITCDNLRSATTIININSATAPNSNQALIAISSGIATWQTINHSNLSNIGINSHAQIDTHLNASSGIHGIIGNIVGTIDAQILTNKTFADSTDNTKKMNFILTPLTTATTVALTIPALSTTLVGIDSVQTLTNKIIISSNYFADQTDNTKKMNFVLSSLVTGTNISLTIPTSSTTLVGIDSNQILTNKTLNSTTNIITCDNLRSATTIVDIHSTIAPILNQALIATSSTAASWQTIDHANISNIGTNNHAQIDIHLGASSNTHGVLGNIVGTSDVQTLTNKTLDITNTIHLLNYSVCLATIITTTSTAYITMSGMSITPVAGSYFVNFSASCYQSNNGTTCNWGICNSATLQPITNVSLGLTMTNSNTTNIMNINYIVVADGINPIQILYKTSAGTITVTNRMLNLIAV